MKTGASILLSRVRFCARRAARVKLLGCTVCPFTSGKTGASSQDGRTNSRLSASGIVVADSLAADPGERFDLVLTNPPFGKKSSTTIVGEEGKVKNEQEMRFPRTGHVRRSFDSLFTIY